MTIRMTSLRRTTAAVAVAGLLGFGLAACGSDSDDGASASPSASETQAEETSEPTPEAEETVASGDGDVAAFCDAALSLSELASIDQSNLEAAMTQMSEATAKLNAATAPAEVAADWNVIVEAYTNLVDAASVSSADPTDAEAQTATIEAAMAMNTPELVASAEKVGIYAGTNCS